MTAEANTEWDHYKLEKAVSELRRLARIENDLIDKLPAGIFGVEERCWRGDDRDAYEHAADFIEYNMREMEINGGNGD
jgi:hypothetical protein